MQRSNVISRLEQFFQAPASIVPPNGPLQLTITHRELSEFVKAKQAEFQMESQIPKGLQARTTDTEFAAHTKWEKDIERRLTDFGRAIVANERLTREAHDKIAATGGELNGRMDRFDALVTEVRSKVFGEQNKRIDALERGPSAAQLTEALLGHKTALDALDATLSAVKANVDQLYAAPPVDANAASASDLEKLRQQWAAVRDNWEKFIRSPIASAIIRAELDAQEADQFRKHVCRGYKPGFVDS